MASILHATIFAAIALLTIGLARSANADIVVRPGPKGHLGIWLAAGPLFGSESNLRFTPVEGTNEKPVQISLGAPVVSSRSFAIQQAANGKFDLQKLYHAQANSYALFAGILRAKAQSRVTLILGTDDGVRVTVDDAVVLNKDLVRPPLHDDDAVEFDLSPGDHPILIRLRQRTGEWKFSARLLDSSNLRPSNTVQFVLPGAELHHVDTQKLAETTVTFAVFANRYEPTLRVTATGGIPIGIELPITARAVANQGSANEIRLFEVALGNLPIGTACTHDLQAKLPTIDAAQLLHGAPQGIDASEAFVVQTTIANHEVSVPRRGHPTVRRALGVIDDALAVARSRASGEEPNQDPSRVILASLELSRSRLEGFISSGDDDLLATVREAESSEIFARNLLENKNPLFEIRGPHRLAYRSPLDGNNRNFGVYVPQLSEGKTYPIVVALHGLNGFPMQMLNIFFGRDRAGRRAASEDRHPAKMPALDAFVVTPSGFGNISYREFGELDVMHVLRWMIATYPVDEDRVYVTGLSMGGTGAAAVALRYPDEFAASVPLCGYHSYSLRSDMANRELRVWEKSLASFWSNVSWAERGKNLPMYIVHGTEDKPVENSGMLIDRYLDLGYPILHEHPKTGHNVWQQTYEGFKAYRWLAQHKKQREPREVVITTPSLRYASRAWVHITGIEQHLVWSKVRAKASADSIDVQTTGVTAMSLDRPTSIVKADARLRVVVDGQTLEFEPSVPIAVRRIGDKWQAVAEKVEPQAQGRTPLRKRAGLSGPIRDAFLEPLVFVVGTRDRSMTEANYYVAQALASPPFGVEARWPVTADVDLTESVASSHALYLIGSAKSNAYVARIADRLPIKLDGAEVVVGDRRFGGAELGSLFVYPNPEHLDRYVIVLLAPDVAGTLRVLSLPRMLPDFLVYDQGLSGARGQMVLGGAKVLAGGMFDMGWGLPGLVTDSVDVGRK